MTPKETEGAISGFFTALSLRPFNRLCGDKQFYYLCKSTVDYRGYKPKNPTPN